MAAQQHARGSLVSAFHRKSWTLVRMRSKRIPTCRHQGAIGLARVFHVGGRIGADLFHPDDPSAKAARSMIWPTRSTISA